jgi:pimeloyl-ACP methyl ester carboxylesterase
MKLSKSAKWWLSAVAGVVVVFVALNLLAWRHASRFVRFAASGTRTLPPENMSVLGRASVLLNGVSIPRPENRRTPADFGLAYSTGYRQTRDGIRIEFWRVVSQATNSPAVILFHGYGGSKDGMLGMASEFASWGCDTWLVDFRGSGGSEGDRTTVGWAEAYEVEAIFTEARRVLGKDRPIFLYGGSMGGAAVMKAASLGWVQPKGIITEATFDRLCNAIGVRFKSMGLPEFPVAHLLTFWGGREAGYDGFEHNPRSYASVLNCPLLLLHGDRDLRVPLAQTLALKAAAGDATKLVRFPGAGHEGGYASAPEEWRAAVREFLTIR